MDEKNNFKRGKNYSCLRSHLQSLTHREWGSEPIRWEQKKKHIRVTDTVTHPLLVQLEELLWDFGGVEGQPQALDVQLGHHVLQDLLQREAAGRAVPGGGGHCVF